VVGLRGASGRFIEELAPICEAQIGDSATAPRPVGRAATDATPFEVRCPPDTIAVGMSVRAGALIDAAGLLCTAPDASVAPE